MILRDNSVWSSLNWVRDTLQPKGRKQDSEKEIQQAREAAKESGTANVFEYDDIVPTTEVPQKSKPSKVCCARVTFSAYAVDAHNYHEYMKHDCRTRILRISHRKLNKLANQISGKPVDTAILQMRFSEKRVSERIRLMLEQAKRVAVERGLEKERLVVCKFQKLYRLCDRSFPFLTFGFNCIAEAWVNKATGGKQSKRLEIKGRGRVGIQTKYKAKMAVTLREGLTFEEKRQKDREARLKKIVSSGLVREDVPLRNVARQWAW